jgi:tryptophanase
VVQQNSYSLAAGIARSADNSYFFHSRKNKFRNHKVNDFAARQHSPGMEIAPFAGNNHRAA